MTDIKKIGAKRILSLFFALLTIFSCFSLTQMDAQAADWTTGCFSGGNRYTAGTRIYLKNKKKDAYVYFYTYKKNGKNCQSRIDILMKDTRGRVIWSGTRTVPKKGLKLKLGKDHSTYVLYFRDHTPGSAAENPEDYNPFSTTPEYWGIKYSTNCHK